MHDGLSLNNSREHLCDRVQGGVEEQERGQGEGRKRLQISCEGTVST